MALAATLVVAVGATTMRYTTVVKEMSVLFNGQVMVTSKDAIVVQAIPIFGGMLPQNFTIKELEGIVGIERVIPVLFVVNTTFSGLGSMPVNFSMGIPVEDWQAVLGPMPLKGNSGHFPTNESGSEVVVGASMADQYNWVVGSRIVLHERELTIVGVLDTKMALLNRCIIMPLKLAQTVHNNVGNINIVAVKPAQGYSQGNLTSAIQREINYVKALTEEERNDVVQPIIAQIESWNVGMQTIILCMSLILVMMVTVMSVSERRRDFATLDAIGAPLHFVFSVVILETSLIGVFGALIGIGFGSLAALLIASVYTNIPLALFFPSIFEIVPPLYMVQMFAAIVFVCCLGGIVPALNAMRMRVAEVLRAEY